MRKPTEFELEQLVHAVYDPVKAHEYYERTKKLKGRRRMGTVDPNSRTSGRGLPKWKDPRTGKTAEQIHKEAVAKQRKELSARIQSLSKALQKLDAKIREMEAKEASENRKSKAKKERAAKDRDKPKTAAEKAKDAREAKKYRDKNQQKLKSKAKEASSSSGGGSSSDKKKSGSTASVSELRTLRTKVKGQLAVAKQKLAAL